MLCQPGSGGGRIWIYLAFKHFKWKKFEEKPRDIAFEDLESNEIILPRPIKGWVLLKGEKFLEKVIPEVNITNTLIAEIQVLSKKFKKEKCFKKIG